MVDFSKTTIYPNPFTNQLIIKDIASDVQRLEIFNISGQLIHSQNVNHCDLIIGELYNILIGLYLI
ncbi:MAG: T9SS type A sorting domain-containing protein [Flavobacteriales bacterium]